MLDHSLYAVGRVVMALIQLMPLWWIAQLGRFGGGVIFWLDGKHRRMAIINLTHCFHPVKSRKEIRALALENFRRIGETYCCSMKTAGMKDSRLREVMAVSGHGATDPSKSKSSASNCIYATGHFGNFELFSRLSMFVHGYRCAATYRGMRPAALNRLVFRMRTKAGGSGLLFERRTDAEELKKTMKEGGVLLILVSDQSARDGGIELPFLGRMCFMTRAPAVMAARYDCDLFVPICYRTGLGQWRIEVSEAIPTRSNGLRRTTEEITRDINSLMEAAVRRDPANWFWVHNRWKTKQKATTEMKTEAIAPEMNAGAVKLKESNAGG